MIAIGPGMIVIPNLPSEAPASTVMVSLQLHCCPTLLSCLCLGSSLPLPLTASLQENVVVGSHTLYICG